jgi:predicted CXXCH cytochrome family protein
LVLFLQSKAAGAGGNSRIGLLDSREFAEGKQEKEQQMRRQHLTQLIGTFVVAAVLIGLPAVALAKISGSAHDLRAQSYTSEVCNVCHTPHNADTTAAGLAAPLWDHKITSTATFTVYSSTTLNASMGQPAGVSKLCLSCHDGSVAIDAFAGATGSTTVTGAAMVGTDLKNDHPVSFTYNTALASSDGELFNPSAANSGPTTTIDADLLFLSKVECSSCHDVHNTAGIPKLLTVNNAASALCLTCHDK